jgi:hypothetical protein
LNQRIIVSGGHARDDFSLQLRRTEDDLAAPQTYPEIPEGKLTIPGRTGDSHDRYLIVPQDGAANDIPHPALSKMDNLRIHFVRPAGLLLSEVLPDHLMEAGGTVAEAPKQAGSRRASTGLNQELEVVGLNIFRRAGSDPASDR